MRRPREDDSEDSDYEEEAHRSSRRRIGRSSFIDDYAVEDDNNDDDYEEGDQEEDGFIVDDTGNDLRVDRYNDRMTIDENDDDEDVDDLERRVQERYSRYHQDDEFDEDATYVEQQALLPSYTDPKLWLVKCMDGHEREVAVCLMQKFMDGGSELKIRSVVALDYLKRYVYVEAENEAHVREAIKGMRNIVVNQVIKRVPIKEMTDVVSVESKAVELGRDTWVRVKSGTYKGDLAKVVDVDNVRRSVRVKLIPRIDLHAIAAKLDGREVAKKKDFVPPPRFMNTNEARELHIRVEQWRDPMTRDYFEKIDGNLFKDGFLYKSVSLKTITTQNVTPTFNELEKFDKPSENEESDVGGMSSLFANRKKGHFMKGDAVIVIKGDLKNLKGWVEKVDEENVLIKSEMKGLPDSLAVNERELCKYFEPGNHVKVVFGTHAGATGMVVKVDQYVLIILSDTTKEHVRVFADYVVKSSSEMTTGVTKIGDYELHDLVLLDNLSFGVITRLENEAFQVLKGVPDRPEVALVKPGEIKCKIVKRINEKDCFKNVISVKDNVKVIEGPSKGKQGPVRHIYNGVLFIYDLEHAGFICAKCTSCTVVGGSRSGTYGNGGDSVSRFGNSMAPPVPSSARRFQRGGMGFNSGGRHKGGRGARDDSLVGTTVKIRLGHFKGCKGPVVGVNGDLVRIELESKIVTVKRKEISDNVCATTPFGATSRYGIGSETPMHPSQTPLHPYMTPMRDSGATPIHDGMRTPMRDRAWNPYTPMTPQYQSGSPSSLGSPGSDCSLQIRTRDRGFPVSIPLTPTPTP